MSDCIFCKIAAGEIPSKRVYEDDDLIAFHDIHPKAPVHVLVVPRRHIASLAEVSPADAELLGRMTVKLNAIAQSQGLDQGFRTIVNTGVGGGQEVFHLHYHILGGPGRLPFA